MTVWVDADRVLVDWHQERDNVDIVAFDNEDRRVVLAEWHDDDARDMIEDGFFKWGDDETVFDYLIDMKIIDYVDADEL